MLRPASYLRHRLERTGATGSARVATPLCRGIDVIAARLSNRVLNVDRGSLLGVPFGPPNARLAEEDVTVAAVRALLAEASPSLYPSYDAPSLAWLLEQAGRTRRHGVLRARLCRDERGDAAGWYVYYAQPGGVSQVLQLGGKPRAIGDVLANLFADAHRAGSVAVTGQAEPRWLREISDAQANLSCKSLGVLVHARDHEIVEAVQRGDSFSRASMGSGGSASAPSWWPDWVRHRRAMPRALAWHRQCHRRPRRAGSPGTGCCCPEGARGVPGEAPRSATGGGRGTRAGCATSPCTPGPRRCAARRRRLRLAAPPAVHGAGDSARGGGCHLRQASTA